MARARQEMARRLGPRGLPVISASHSTYYVPAVVAAVSAARPNPPPLIYTSNYSSAAGQATDITSVAGEATESTVSGWLARRERGEEEKDLVTVEEMIRGWETDAAIVVIYKRGLSSEANCVMRAVAHVITLTEV
jgi:hypothetical protein